MFDLTGRVALVTGGSRGIGAATAKRLARDGASVALTYNTGEEPAGRVVKEIEAAGGRALAIRADAESAEAVVAAVDRTATEFGRLDVLVNNAGVGVMGPLEDMSLEDVNRVLAINVRAAFAAAQAAARHMGEGGRIITTGSCVADRTPFPGMTLYALSKSAMSGLTKGLARDLGGRGITANAVVPGPIDTGMNPADGPAGEAQAGLTSLGRYGTPDEVADLVAYLASDGARYISGAELSVDGGFAA